MHCVTECKEDQFQCKNKAYCIPIRWLCDGIQDCVDNSDELNCDRGENFSPSFPGYFYSYLLKVYPIFCLTQVRQK